MIPIPLSWALSGIAGAVALTVLAYEGVPFVAAGRVDRAYTAGETAERQVWEELRRLQLAARETEKREAETRIAKIEGDYWRQSELQKFRISELERVIETEPATDETEPGADIACIRPPAISKRMRDALDAIGR